MEISDFQIINLVNNRVPFLFVDLTNGKIMTQLESSNKKYFENSKPTSYFKAENFVLQNIQDKSQPVIVFHNYVWLAKRVTQKLEKKHKLVNVYYLDKSPINFSEL